METITTQSLSTNEFQYINYLPFRFPSRTESLMGSGLNRISVGSTLSGVRSNLVSGKCHGRTQRGQDLELERH